MVIYDFFKINKKKKNYYPSKVTDESILTAGTLFFVTFCMARSLCTLQQQIFTDKFDGFMTIISALRQQEGEMDMKGFQNLVSLINTMY